MAMEPGKMVQMSASRIPLQEQKESNINHAIPEDPKIIETPMTHKSYNTKITTPPGSIMGAKKNMMMDTPLGKMDSSANEIVSVNTTTKSALLSPAFSSPQQRRESRIRQVGSPPKPTFGSSFSSSSFSSDDDNNATKPMKKKKKSRKELKEQAFDFDSSDKPPYSYATLIGMSILSNHEKRLTLSQIYSWISDTFRYYKRDEVGWQNSIRHNLSLNKAFIKGEKSKDGKGHFWCIKTGCEEQFLKTRSNKKHSYQEVMDQIYSSNSLNKEEKRSINSIPSSPNVSNDIDEENSFYRKRVASEIDEAADYSNVDDFEDELSHTLLDHQYKKQKLLSVSLDDGSLGNVSNLGSNLHATPNSFKVRNTMTPLLANAPHFIISESPNKPLLAGKNLAYSSSFSCNSNLELSPIRPSETGPLLEPLTPANNIYNQSNLLNQHQLQSNSKLSISANHLNHNLSHPNILLQKTPKSNNLRTPLKLLKTPQTNSIIKKLWNSPSYLEEFYYSPLASSSTSLLNSYDDDDMILRNFEAQHSPGYLMKKQEIFESSRNLINDFKKYDNTSKQSTSGKDSKHFRKISSSSTELDE